MYAVAVVSTSAGLDLARAYWEYANGSPQNSELDAEVYAYNSSLLVGDRQMRIMTTKNERLTKVGGVWNIRASITLELARAVTRRCSGRRVLPGKELPSGSESISRGHMHERIAGVSIAHV